MEEKTIEWRQDTLFCSFCWNLLDTTELKVALILSTTLWESDFALIEMVLCYCHCHYQMFAKFICLFSLQSMVQG